MEPVGLPTSGPTSSALSHLEGALSGLRYEADRLIGLDLSDGRPLLARYELSKAGRTLTAGSVANRTAGGLWRWHELLPVRRWEFVVHMGEGSTPLQPARRLGPLLGLSNLLLKRESMNPTGSFKARGMAVAVSRAVELGVKHLVAPSAGNAGGALAAYAAASGVRATVVMPADSPAANQTEVLIAGASLILLDGLISDCGRLARLIAESLGAFDMSTLKEPYRVEGKKTMGFELAEQLRWRLPDAIVYPTGGGTGLIGMWKAFNELQDMGFIGADRPRMFSVQAEGCAPIVRAFAEGQRFAAAWDNAVTAAAGIRVPSAVGDFLILDCLRESKGAAVAVPERELPSMQRRMAEAGAGYLSLETAAAVAAVPMLLEARRIDRDEVVVVFDTGAGFKSEPPSDLPIPVRAPNDPSTWDGIVSQLAKRG
ncbi:MAG TPA: threonine synthase [Candidatus Dormibacteraeota bacterium]|nr:threonine synthase [Candidatus Dormibacteraeota bacterium]